VSPGEEAKKFRWHRRAERNPRLAKQAKTYHGVTCKVCGFNFEEAYGPHGQGYIEAHHLVSFSTLSARPDTVILDPKPTSQLSAPIATGCFIGSPRRVSMPSARCLEQLQHLRRHSRCTRPGFEHECRPLIPVGARVVWTYDGYEWIDTAACRAVALRGRSVPRRSKPANAAITAVACQASSTLDMFRRQRRHAGCLCRSRSFGLGMLEPGTGSRASSM
jgi:hypothetical protein